MVAAAFVAPYLMEATARFVADAAALPGVRLGLITCDPLERIPPVLRERLAGHWRVDNALDPRQIAEAVSGLSRQMGRVERLVGALEQLQVPLAQVREAMGIEGMDEQTAHNVRDKSRMKDVLRAAGVPCAAHALVTGAAEATAFAREVGFPLVAKPPAGAGSQATYRLDDAESLAGWLHAVPPSAEQPALLEEFLVGEEHTFDSVTIGGDTVWSSIADYQPPPLEVLRNPWIQWTVMLPRDISGPSTPASTRSARPRCGPSGSATRSPTWSGSAGRTARWRSRRSRPGPRERSSPRCTATPTTSTCSRPGRSWSCSTGSIRPSAATPAGRRTCAAWARGGCAPSTVSRSCSSDLGHLVVESRLPQPGQPAASDYLGEGYVMVRDAETEVVREALRRIIGGVRVELVEAL